MVWASSGTIGVMVMGFLIGIRSLYIDFLAGWVVGLRCSFGVLIYYYYCYYYLFLFPGHQFHHRYNIAYIAFASLFIIPFYPRSIFVNLLLS